MNITLGKHDSILKKLSSGLTIGNGSKKVVNFSPYLTPIATPAQQGQHQISGALSNVFFAHTASHYRLTLQPCGHVSLAINSRHSAKRSQFDHFQVCPSYSQTWPLLLSQCLKMAKAKHLQTNFKLENCPPFVL